ncbi:MAG: hypothetical protein WCG87_13110, partial [Bacteroidota bacterium]
LIFHFVLSVVFVPYSLYGQESAPKAVLIQLNSYKNKIDYYQRTGKEKNAIDLKKDVDSFAVALRKDFKERFDYCEVYYFYDSNLQKIKNKDLINTLYNAEGALLSQSPIPFNDSSYIITCLGFEAQKGRKGLIILDHNYKEIHLITKPEFAIFKSDSRSKYGGIEYYAFSTDLNNYLKQADRKYERK